MAKKTRDADLLMEPIQQQLVDLPDREGVDCASVEPTGVSLTRVSWSLGGGERETRYVVILQEGCHGRREIGNGLTFAQLTELAVAIAVEGANRAAVRETGKPLSREQEETLRTIVRMAITDGGMLASNKSGRDGEIPDGKDLDDSAIAAFLSGISDE